MCQVTHLANELRPESPEADKGRKATSAHCYRTERLPRRQRLRGPSEIGRVCKATQSDLTRSDTKLDNRTCQAPGPAFERFDQSVQLCRLSREEWLVRARRCQNP